MKRAWFLILFFAPWILLGQGRWEIWNTATTMATRDDTLCTIELEQPIVHITPGKEKECWEVAVRAHNENMNDDKEHVRLDRILELLAAKLGKTIHPCARAERKEPRQ